MPGPDWRAHLARVRLAEQRAANTPVSVIREWARRHGYRVGPNGRLPDEVLDAYREAWLDTDAP